MKNNKILLTMGAIVLTIATGVFAANRTKRFSAIDVWYKVGGTGTCTLLLGSANSIFTSTSGVCKAKIVTAGCNMRTLYSNNTCTATNVWFKL